MTAMVKVENASLSIPLNSPLNTLVCLLRILLLFLNISKVQLPFIYILYKNVEDISDLSVSKYRVSPYSSLH